MASTLHQLEQAIAAAEQESQRAAEQIYAAYRDYLQAIASASHQRLILAAYHVCTHNYPQAFLKLSLAQRQTLQKSLRHLGQRLETQTLALLNGEPAANPGDRTAANVALPEAMISSSLLSELEAKLRDQFGIEIGTLPKRLPSETSTDPDTTPAVPNPEPTNSNAEQPLEATAPPHAASSQEPPAVHDPDPSRDTTDPAIGESDQDLHAFEGDRPSPPNPEDPKPDPGIEGLPAEISRVPHRIAMWLQSRDHLLITTLQTFSHKANRLLHNHQILPRKLPGSLLEIATQADLGSDHPAAAPSLLNLTIATGNDDNGEEDPRPMRLVAIHLRPDDLHLADANVARCARHLRTLITKLESLAQRYERIHRQLVSARAEAAWRSSWFNDDPSS